MLYQTDKMYGHSDDKGEEETREEAVSLTSSLLISENRDELNIEIIYLLWRTD